MLAAAAVPLPGELWWALLSRGHRNFLAPKKHLRKGRQNFPAETTAIVLCSFPTSLAGCWCCPWREDSTSSSCQGESREISQQVPEPGTLLCPAMCCLFTWALPSAFTCPPTHPHPVCSDFLSSPVSRCEKVCASSVTAVLSLPSVGWGNARQHQITLCTQTPRDKAVPGAIALHSPLQADVISLHMLLSVEPFPFQQGPVSLSLPGAAACLGRSSPSCC